MASVTLKHIPEKEFDFILKVQSDEKRKKKKGVYSQESAIIKIIKEYMELTEKNKKT